MIAQKHITKVIAAAMALAVCLCLCAAAFSGQIKAAAGDTGISMEYETALFGSDGVISVNILMDEADWNDMLENAMSEEYYQCDVEINGTTFYRVGIRPKGNTSLSSIASDPTTDRYSFKLEFDHYVDGQTCFGLDKLILNNNYADATNMKEALIYDMYRYLGADASLYNYAKISVNGQYWGVYLALEAVEDSFMLRNYGAQSGELYKPEGMDMGGGKAPGGQPADFGNMDFGSMTPPDRQENTSPTDSSSQSQTPDAVSAPTQKPDSSGENSAESPTDSDEHPSMNFNFGGGKGGFSMSSGGANLNYSDDDLDSYETIWDGEITNTTKADHKRVVTALKNISQGTDLADYMDIDNLLRYMAVHIFSVNEDSLSGAMAHNYYLYESGGKLNLIPWDYNLALGGMGGGSDASSVVNSPIDDAFQSTDFFDTLMEDETCHSQYYAYLQQLVSEYINGGGFDAFYERVRSQIDALVETDPTAFYTYDEYQTAADTLYQVVKLRGESIQGQLDGTIPSTESAQRGSDALVDASALDLSVMGTMNAGGGKDRPRNMNQDAAKGGAENDTAVSSENAAEGNAENSAADSAEGTSKDATAASAENGAVDSSGNAPKDDSAAQTPPAMPDSATGDASAPSGSDSDSAQPSGEPPEKPAGSQTGGETQTPSDDKPSGGESQTPSGDAPSSGESSSDSAPGDAPASPPAGDFPGDGFPGGNPGGNTDGSGQSTSGNALFWYGGSLLVLAAAMLFALLYRRKPQRR